MVARADVAASGGVDAVAASSGYYVSDGADAIVANQAPSPGRSIDHPES